MSTYQASLALLSHHLPGLEVGISLSSGQRFSKLKLHERRSGNLMRFTKGLEELEISIQDLATIRLPLNAPDGPEAFDSAAHSLLLRDQYQVFREKGFWSDKDIFISATFGTPLDPAKMHPKWEKLYLAPALRNYFKNCILPRIPEVLKQQGHNDVSSASPEARYWAAVQLFRQESFDFYKHLDPSIPLLTRAMVLPGLNLFDNGEENFDVSAFKNGEVFNGHKIDIPSAQKRMRVKIEKNPAVPQVRVYLRNGEVFNGLIHLSIIDDSTFDSKRPGPNSWIVLNHITEEQVKVLIRSEAIACVELNLKGAAQ